MVVLKSSCSFHGLPRRCDGCLIVNPPRYRSFSSSGSGSFLPSFRLQHFQHILLLSQVSHLHSRERSGPSSSLRLSPRTVEEEEEAEAKGKMKVMTPTTTATTTTWSAVVVCMCANNGGGRRVACWFVSEQTRTGGEHLSYDGRTDGPTEGGREGRIHTQPRVGEREAVDAWYGEARR